MLVAVWLSILSGFVYNNEQIYRTGHLTYPWIVHIHAAFFVGWLLLFTAQLVLVRRGQVSTHRRLGMFGAGLAAVMVAFGVITAILTEQLKFGTPASDLPFLIVMFADMLVFGGLVTTGILLRRSPAAHKRLMLIATLVLTDAVWPLAQSKGRRVDGTEELLGLEDLCGRRLAVHPPRGFTIAAWPHHSQRVASLSCVTGRRLSKAPRDRGRRYSVSGADARLGSRQKI